MLTSQLRNGMIAAVLPVALALATAQPAAAAMLREVQDFGQNPAKSRMFIYVPDKPAASPPILVAIHYCGGNANGYFNGTGYRGLADRHGFIVIYPQTTSSDGCFDVHSEATLKHDGGSDSASIVSMVRYAIMNHSGAANRVYVAGTSSGAMMTNVLLGAYPDVFQGGASFAGVPFACFAGAGAWNNACASGQTTKTGAQWGDLVRAAYPGYTGPRPRVQLWHGDRDETLNFHNFGEAIKQWTNVLGVSEMPTTTERNAPQMGWTRTRYADAGGVVRVEAVLEAGVMHNLNVPAAEVVRFFGLDGTADPGAPSAPSGGAGGAGAAGAAGGGGAGNVAGGGAGRAAAAAAGAEGGAGRSSAAAGGGAGAGAAGTTPEPSPPATVGIAGGAGMPPMAAEPMAGAGDPGPGEMPSSSDSCSVRGAGAPGGRAAFEMLCLGLALGLVLRSRRRQGAARSLSR